MASSYEEAIHFGSPEEYPFCFLKPDPFVLFEISLETQGRMLAVQMARQTHPSGRHTGSSFLKKNVNPKKAKSVITLMKR